MRYGNFLRNNSLKSERLRFLTCIAEDLKGALTGAPLAHVIACSRLKKNCGRKPH